MIKLDNICNDIKDKHQFHYDLNNILSDLIYSRIIYPSSKLKTLEVSKNFLEQPHFSYNDILRSLDVLSKESNFIQSELYKNSLNYSKRNDKVLFYDCTNYYFEIEESFRIMKSEFKAKPVYLSREDRIKAHFLTCFLSLVILTDLLHEKFGFRTDYEGSSSKHIKKFVN